MKIPPRRILIATYYFYPENAPRAFRSFELAKQFSKEGNQVTVYLPDYGAGEPPWLKAYPMELVRVSTGFLLNRKAKQWSGLHAGFRGSPRTGGILRKTLKFLFNLVYWGGEPFEYWIPLFLSLLREKRKFDLLVSIGLPFSVHLGTYVALLVKPGLGRIKVAEYGDPFAANPQSSFHGLHHLAEKIVLKKFDYVTVPTVKAVPAFTDYKGRDKIKVIPQGLDFKSIPIASYRKGRIPTFAYAGLFYSRIRNPVNFFKFLSGLKTDFRFILFTDLLNADNMSCLKPWMEALEEKMDILHPLPREKCIYELSKMDFLVNVNNLSETQSPSKLVDYTLAKRPIFSLDSRHFDEKIFLDFLKGRFGKVTPAVNLEDFDIVKTARSFMDLVP